MHLKDDPTGKGHRKDGQGGGQEAVQEAVRDNQGSGGQDQPAGTMQQRNTMNLAEVN